MLSKLLILTCLISLAAGSVLLSKGPAVSSQKVTRYDDIHEHDSQSGYQNNVGHSSGPRYEFKYSVSDPHTQDEKSQQESRYGDVVQGEYSLLQPDGSYTKVEYTADDHNGFNAVVHNTATDHQDGTSIVHDQY